FARYVSAFKEERVEAAKHLTGPSVKDEEVDKAYWIEQVKEALFMGKICAYAQGFHQYQQASEQYGWDLNLDEIALILEAVALYEQISSIQLVMHLRKMRL